MTTLNHVLLLLDYISYCKMVYHIVLVSLSLPDWQGRVARFSLDICGSVEAALLFEVFTHSDLLAFSGSVSGLLH